MPSNFNFYSDPVKGAFTKTITNAKDSTVVSQIRTVVTVGVNEGKVDFTTIGEAVESLSETGGRILVKSGVYLLSETIVLPNQNIIIEGENVDGVIIDGDSSITSAFSFISSGIGDHFSSVFALKNITIQNFTSYGITLSNGADASDHFGTVLIDSISSINNSSFIYIKNFDSLEITNSSIYETSGTYAVRVDPTVDTLSSSLLKLSFIGNTVNNYIYGIQSSTNLDKILGESQIRDNIFTQCIRGICIGVNDLYTCKVESNYIELKIDYYSGERHGVFCSGRFFIFSNKIVLEDIATPVHDYQAVYGIKAYNSSVISSNYIYIREKNQSGGTNASSRGIYLNGMEDGIVSDNTVDVSTINLYSFSYEYCIGIDVDCVRNTVSGNRLTVTSAIGFRFTIILWGDNNKVSGNLLLNGSVSDNGTGNDITDNTQL